MTAEAPIDRIEHIMAGWAEERRKDREEYRQLWRDTQHQINELTFKIAATNDAVAATNDTVTLLATELRNELRVSDKRARAAEQELRDRIQALISAIGQMLPK
ncbi:hypothetical protein SBA4_3910006 [Candidatus Sulfopaludibacter sp. SbA4]|nr:hypothetical protein SBA4_3910006 [Candidatus Sulfopaludibacter sp. SbA4]